MCPVCIATAAVIAGKAATSTGGLAALAVKKDFLKNVANKFRHLRFFKVVKN
jgi:hypothetical protein